MSHPPVPVDERWLHAVSGSAVAELDAWADDEPAGLLDGPVMFGLYSRSDPVGAEAQCVRALHELLRRRYDR